MGLRIQEHETAATSSRQRHMRENPPVADQLKAIWQYIESRRQAGEVLPRQVATMLDQILNIEARYPDQKEKRSSLAQ